MTDNQVPFSYDSPTIDALKASLSEPRFAAYRRRAGGDETFALELYLYNARLAKSCLFPLSVTEVTFRNAVDSVLVREYGAEWHRNDDFRSNVLTPESCSSLDKGVARALSTGLERPISTLTFDFWSNLFRIEYASLWRTKANIAFPGLEHGQGRRHIQALAREINRLRNRVAHHEPLLGEDVSALHGKMIELVKLRCPVTSNWMRRHSTVGTVMCSRPNAAGSTTFTLESRTDPNFREVSPESTLTELARSMDRNRVAFVCLENGSVTGAFTNQQLANFICEQAVGLEGLVDLSDHTVADVLNSPDVAGGFHVLGAGTPFPEAVATLKEPETRVVVAVSPHDRKPVGVILRAHRRY